MTRSQFTTSAIILVLPLLISVLLGCAGFPLNQLEVAEQEDFDGERAYQDVLTQLEFGPRIPGTEGHQRTVDWLVQELTVNDWEVEIQELEYRGKPIRNVIASRGAGEYIVLGAHYDTRIFADQDPNPENRDQPVPGANDGASGVAVLVELARILPADLPIEVQLVFFDAEDNGGIEDWDWILGSSAYVDQLVRPPQAAIIVDMIGDADLDIYYERNSDLRLMEQIWESANTLGYSGIFIPEYKHSMLDDHTPFIQADIPAVDIIDFDYPSWHTLEDTADKVTSESLNAVGSTLLFWILDWNPE